MPFVEDVEVRRALQVGTLGTQNTERDSSSTRISGVLIRGRERPTASLKLILLTNSSSSDSVHSNARR